MGITFKVLADKGDNLVLSVAQDAFKGGPSDACFTTLMSSSLAAFSKQHVVSITDMLYFIPPEAGIKGVHHHHLTH